MPNFGGRVWLVIMRDGKGNFWGFGHSVCPEFREGELGKGLMVPHGKWQLEESIPAFLSKLL